MEHIIVPIGKVKANPKNPRLIKDDKFKKLVRSVKEFPEMLLIRPIVVNKKMVVLGGNMRLKACLAAGIKEIPIIKADFLTPTQEREFVIKDNISGGEWDWDILANEWDPKILKSWGMDLPTDFNDGEGSDDEYEIPNKVKTDIKLGDLFEIGPHRLLCGDSTKHETFDKLFAGKMADLVITDPPYNVAIQGGNHGNPNRKNGLKIENDQQSDADFYQFLCDFYKALGAFTKPGGAWYVWHADSEGANFRKAMADMGIFVKQCLIWVKNSMVMGRQDYQWKHEPCLYGWREGGPHKWYGDRKQTTILEFERPTVNAEHPTMKPVPLIAYQIKNSSKAGDIVADGFGGSGTTMVASHQLKRRCFMTEFDPKYCQVIVDRMIKLDPTLELKRNGKKYVKNG